MSGFNAEEDGMFGSDDEETSIAVCHVVESELRAAEVRPVPNVGGGRGVVATCNLPAGTLVVLEWPSLTWHHLDVSLESDMLNLIDQILSDPVALDVSKTLHPRSLTDVPDEERDAALSAFEDDSDALQRILSHSSREDIARVYLTLKHNGFGSGLYRDLCMINHSCAPNCMKFEPRSGSRGASEVWTTRPVLAGEELTISYCSPLESLSAPMRQYLSDQHGFECCCPRCQSFLNWQHEQKMQQTCEANGATDCNHEHEAESLHTSQSEDWDAWVADCEADLSVVEYRSREDLGVLQRMLQESQRIHLLLKGSEGHSTHDADLIRLQSRNCMLQTSIALKELSIVEDIHSMQKKSLLQSIAMQLFCSGAEALALQRRYLGADHPDLLTTLTDLESALQFVSRSHSAADVQTAVDRVHWDACGCTLAPNNSPTVKTVRTALLSEINRLKSSYSLAKRCPNAVRVSKKPALSFWAPQPNL